MIFLFYRKPVEKQIISSRNSISYPTCLLFLFKKKFVNTLSDLSQSTADRNACQDVLQAGISVWAGGQEQWEHTIKEELREARADPTSIARRRIARSTRVLNTSLGVEFPLLFAVAD